MKDIRPKLINLFKEGNCTPQISVIAKKLKEPSTTIHYNIKKLEQEGAIKSYKAVFNYKKIDEGFCAYIFINIAEKDYSNPEIVAKEIAKDSRVESIDICTGDYELLIKMRTKDIDEYYETIKQWVGKFKFRKTTEITSLRQIKSEFISVE